MPLSEVCELTLSGVEESCYEDRELTLSGVEGRFMKIERIRDLPPIECELDTFRASAFGI